MIKRKYAYIKIDNDNINFEDVENTITYSLSAKNLENNLNKREEELCNKIAELEAKLAESEFAHNSYFEKAEATISFLQQQFNEKGKIEEQLEELKQQLVEKEEQLKEDLIEKKGLERALSACNRQNDEFADMIKKLVNEKEELKQQLHDLPKNIVGEIRDVARDYWDFNMCEECGNVPDLNTLTTKDFDEILDTILEKYGWGKSVKKKT